jgi:hypothetical protein
MYNRPMAKRLLLCLCAAVLIAGCSRNREIEKELQIIDVRTGWYDAGIVEGDKNKLVPSISLKIKNTASEPIAGVQVNAIFRRVGEQEAWGEHFVTAINRDGLPGGATGGPIVLRSNLGYTGSESRITMLQNSQFIDARVEIFGKQGSRTWVKLGEFPIERKLLTE